MPKGSNSVTHFFDLKGNERVRNHEKMDYK